MVNEDRERNPVKRSERKIWRIVLQWEISFG